MISSNILTDKVRLLKKKKKIGDPNLDPAGLNQSLNEGGFFSLLRFRSLIFLEIAYSDSL